MQGTASRTTPTHGAGTPVSLQPPAAAGPPTPAPAPRPWTQAPLVRYTAALLAVLAAWALRAALDPLLGGLQPFTLFFVPVLIMGTWFGSGPAALAALLGWFVGDWFFCYPRHVLLTGAPAQEITATLIYTAISATLVSLTHYLRRAHRQVEAILSSITDAFFSLDRQWRFTHVNPEAQRIFRQPAAQLLGRNLFELFPGGEAFRQHYEQALATGQAAHFETFYRPFQGWFEVHAYPSAAGLSVYCRDVTERHRAELAHREAEEAFRQNQERLTLATLAARLGTWDWDLASDRLIWSPTCFELFGLSPDTSPTYSRIQQAIHPEDRDRVDRVTRAALQEHQDYDVEMRVLRPDGSTRWITSRGRAYCDPSGKPLRMSGILLDITEQRGAQEALRRSEALYRTIAQNIPDGALSVVDRDLRYLMAEGALLPRLGLSKEMLQGRTVQETYGGELGSTRAEHFRRALAGETTSNEAHYHGRTVWSQFVPLRDDRGQVFAALSLVLDITDRTRAQEALRHSEERLRKAIATPTIGVLFFSLDGRMQEANAAFQRMSGYSAEELRTRHWKTLTAPESWEATARTAHQLATQGETAPYEKEMVRQDGSRWWGLFAPTRLSGTGPTAECMEFVVDITKRKQAEAALQRQTFHLQLLHQASARLLVGQQPVQLLRQIHPQIAQAFGADAFMLYQADPNSGRLRLLAASGFTEEEQQKLQTLRYGRAICAKPAEALQPIIATHIQDREAPNRRFVRKLGLRSYLYYPLILNNHLHGTVAFASRTRDDYDRMDLDFFHTIAGTLAEALERERLETELQRHAADLEKTVRERTAKLRDTVADLEGFSYSLVHDLRAPLRAMQGYASLLEVGAASRLHPQETDLLRKIKAAADRLDQLITDSLNYTRILRQELPLRPVNLGRLLRDLVDTYPNLHPPQADIAVDLGDLFVHGNQAALTQVFSNLLGNAVKFVAPGVHPRVRVWAEPSGLATINHQPSTRVFIQDNGIGIPEEAHQRIFGMFQRMHGSGHYAGTGIGLALVKKSLDRTGGRITLESAPGHGSRFCVELPLASAP